MIAIIWLGIRRYYNFPRGHKTLAGYPALSQHYYNHYKRKINGSVASSPFAKRTTRSVIYRHRSRTPIIDRRLRYRQRNPPITTTR